MKHSLLFAISLAALSLAGCGKKAEPVGEASPSATASDDLAMAPASAEASAGQTFANTAAASDMFEIETSKLAATKAQSAKVKSFAEQMIKAHTESTAKLKTAAAAASPAIVPVPQLTAIQQQTIDALSAKSGAEFDSAYAQAQSEAHQTALDGLKSYSTTGEVPSLKAFAAELVPIVTAHLNMAKALQP
jgi:putative membrane protein